MHRSPEDSFKQTNCIRGPRRLHPRVEKFIATFCLLSWMAFLIALAMQIRLRRGRVKRGKFTNEMEGKLYCLAPLKINSSWCS